MSKWRKKELQSSMRFPHLLALMEDGDLTKHFPNDDQNYETMKQNVKIISIEKTLEESIETNMEDNEDIDDPEAVYVKEEESKQDPTEMYILPS